MKFKRKIFGFMDMLRFKHLVPNRKKMLQSGPTTPLKQSYRVNEQAKRLHPGYMKVKVYEIRKISETMTELTFTRTDSNEFPFFRAGQYVSLQVKIGESLVNRPYSIVSSPKDALKNKLVLGIEKAGYVSNYLCDEVKVGDEMTMLEPSGNFYYEQLRDKENVVFIAGGSGITPFMSLIKAKIENTENINSITLFYGCKDLNHISYKEELDKLNNGKDIKVIYVLSDEKVEGFEHGFITSELISKYVNPNEVTYFLCGSDNMYNFVLPELNKFHLEIKDIHKDSSCCKDLEIENPRVFNLTIHIQDEIYNIKANENETILVALERAGINAPNKCRAGACGFCHSKLIKGDFIIAKDRDGRREADKKFGFIHPCVSYPTSDLEIIVNSGE